MGCCSNVGEGGAMTGKEAWRSLRDRLVRIAVGVLPRARGRLGNARGESRNVHFRPLFPEGSCEVIGLDTAGKEHENAGYGRNDGKRAVIPDYHLFTPQFRKAMISRRVKKRPLSSTLHDKERSHSRRRGRSDTFIPIGRTCMETRSPFSTQGPALPPPPHGPGATSLT